MTAGNILISLRAAIGDVKRVSMPARSYLDEFVATTIFSFHLT